MRPVRIRALQSLGEDAAALTGVARAALNLRGIDRSDVRRGMALVQPGRWILARQVDVRLSQDGGLVRTVTVHVGSARTPAKVRMLGDWHARLTLRDPLPLHVADRLLLRDPGSAADSPAGELALWHGITGAVVLDVTPPPRRRGGRHRGTRLLVC
jgi:selenocysteine-specific elongation factor